MCLNGTPGPLDHLFRRYMELYQPYIENSRVFDDSRASRILAPSGIHCPALSYPIFERCMIYALQNNNWGGTLGL